MQCQRQSKTKAGGLRRLENIYCLISGNTSGSVNSQLFLRLKSRWEHSG